MALTLFDKKFGKDRLADVPALPGVYSFLNAEEGIVYVGKAKNLRRRIQQYRRARGGKMRKIVKAASSLNWVLCDSELDACLLELRHIQQQKPKLNVAGRFSYRYPLIGFQIIEREFHFCFTTTPEVFSDYQFYGAYRSRSTTSEAFFAMIQLLQYIGHATPRKKAERQAYSYEFALRRLPQEWLGLIDSFLRGKDAEWLEHLVLKLLENAGARSQSEKIQEGLDAIKTFWKDECEPLARAMARVGYETFPVPQTERDPLFVRSGFLERAEEP